VSLGQSDQQAVAADRKENIMRHVILGVAAVAFVSASVALAHNTPWAWTEPKAEKMVVRDASVRLQGSERTALEDELQRSVSLYGLLAFAAADAGDAKAERMFSTLFYRFRNALEDVRGGLEIDTADCRGSGTPQRGSRFKHFRCAATSEVLEIPSAELVDSEEGQLPTVIEGPPRILGPWRAQLEVHPTGRSAMMYRQMG
jgi:hypothetical protein